MAGTAWGRESSETGSPEASETPVRSLYQAAAEAGQRIDPFPVPSPRPTPFREFKGAFWTDVGFAVAGSVTDLGTTEWTLRRCPACQELNPLGQGQWRRIALKALSVSIRARTSYSLRRRGHKGTALAVRYVWFAVELGAAAHNIHAGR